LNVNSHRWNRWNYEAPCVTSVIYLNTKAIAKDSKIPVVWNPKLTRRIWNPLGVLESKALALELRQALNFQENLMKIFLRTRYLIMLAISILPSCASEPIPQPQPQPQPPPKEVVKEEPKPEYIQVALRDAGLIGQKIWMNEGSAKEENLVAWNKGEGFASLGIGHFIWYPEGQEGPYTETFPQFIRFLQQKTEIEIPAWLTTTPDAPWKSYEAFNFNKEGPQMADLRTLLINTIPYQVQFIIQRLEQALPQMLNTLPIPAQREHVFQQFFRVVDAPNGLYALVDYVNFKGEGTNPNERYNEQGWGLLQVLGNMPGNTSNVMTEFANAADKVLRERIQNSPPERGESRWYDGWKNRVKTYTY
jgi:hypothetical protein